MSDSEDDASGATALPRAPKSIFSTMGRVRNMNHLREKWTARGKLSSGSGASELEASGSGGAASLVAAQLKKRASPAAATTATATSGGNTTAKRPTTATAAVAVMTPLEAQRLAALAAWLRQLGLAVPSVGGGDAFDSLYASLDEMETAVKRELALMWPSVEGTVRHGDPPRHPSYPSSLVDYLVVIGPDVADLATRAFWFGKENVYEATVVFAHPPESQFTAECIEQFCFPRGIVTGEAHEPEAADEFFALVLSGGGDQGQSVQYACCLRKHIVIHGSSAAVEGTILVPVCYAVVVSIPWIPFYYQLLRHLAARHQEDLWKLKRDELQSTIVPDSLAQYIDSMMSALAVMELPARGDELRFTWSPIAASFSCVRPRRDCGAPETVALLLDWATRQLLSVLSVERLIMVIGLLLVEMKVVVVSKSMPLLSAGTVGLAALLYPLVWAGPLITILPPTLHEYLEAPVPLLCGVDVLPEQFVLTKGTAVLLIDKDEVQLHADDAAQMGALQFPGSEGLSRQLRAFASRLLSLPSSHDQSRTVIANFVARRIRRQLLDLLLLCARVNPCNAYACMKQEQLSLSETLFLKAFMQSQMYQKYSDDQCSSQLSEGQNKQDQTPDRGATTVFMPSPPVRICTHLVPSIRDVFMLAITGSCSPMDLDSTPLREKEPMVNEGDMEEDDASRQSHPEELWTKSAQSSHSSSTSASPLEGVRRESLGESSLQPLQKTESPANQIAVQMNKLTQWAQSLPRASEKWGDKNRTGATHDSDEQKPRSTPVSTEKPFDSIQPSSQDGMRPNAARSMPDVLVSPEETRPPDRAETDNLTMMATLTSELSEQDTGETHRFFRGNSWPEPRRSHEHSVLAQLSQNLAAAKIQSAWRKWRQKLFVVHRTLSSRAPSMASARSASDTAFPSSVGDWTPAELLFGTILSTYTERGRVIDVRMRLSTDTKSLQWYQGDTLRGNIALTDVQEVQAHDGNIIIQTATNGPFTFIVPSQGASGVMAFFQGLHRLATAGSSGLPSPATSIASSVHNSHTPGISRQESALVETTAQVKETSSHDRKQTIGENHAGASSFLTFDDSLRRGILVLKHGRMGRPHPKFLVCDDSLEILSWVDPIVTNAGFQPPLVAFQQLGHPEKKGIRFEDITGLLRGKRTRVLQRSTAGRSNTELCFSIITRARTLDIETFSREDFKLLFDGIQERVVCPSSPG